MIPFAIKNFFFITKPPQTTVQSALDQVLNPFICGFPEVKESSGCLSIGWSINVTPERRKQAACSVLCLLMSHSDVILVTIQLKDYLAVKTQAVESFPRRCSERNIPTTFIKQHH